METLYGGIHSLTRCLLFGHMLCTEFGNPSRHFTRDTVERACSVRYVFT